MTTLAAGELLAPPQLHPHPDPDPPNLETDRHLANDVGSVKAVAPKRVSIRSIPFLDREAGTSVLDESVPLMTKPHHRSAGGAALGHHRRILGGIRFL
jgi:hypothetical protein